jgi:hypothetical protein
VAETAARLPITEKPDSNSEGFEEKGTAEIIFRELVVDLGAGRVGNRPVLLARSFQKLTILLNVLIFGARWCRS